MTEQEPTEMMPPRQHYAAATKLITEGLSKLDQVTQSVSNIDASWQARAELIALADVHARLATVPQQQFDAWKAEGKGSTMYVHRQPGSPFGQPSHTGMIADCDHPLCMDYVEAVRGQWDKGVIDLPSAAASGRGSRLQLGDADACPHGFSSVRCRLCHQGQQPNVTCGACGTPAWQSMRTVGSRCDLAGCGGLMVDYPGPRP